jgi:dGTP triphosphohydrolase
MMTGLSLRTHEREVERARAKLTQDLAVFSSPEMFADVTDTLKQEAVKTRQALWEKLRAQAAANPAAVLAIAAGLGWRLLRHPPIASSLIGLGIFSLLRTSAKPLDHSTSFLQQSTRSLKGQGEELASAISGAAAEAKDAIAAKTTETKDSIAAKATEAWDSARERTQKWNEQAGERLATARLQVKSAGETVMEGVRRQQHDLRDEIADVTAAASETLRDEDTRNTLLIGIAGVAVAAALGIAAQKRIVEPTDT